MPRTRNFCQTRNRITSLLASMLTIDPLPAALQELALERAQGNPFFLEEASDDRVAPRPFSHP